jgi:hypothetical protein
LYPARSSQRQTSALLQPLLDYPLLNFLYVVANSSHRNERLFAILLPATLDAIREPLRLLLNLYNAIAWVCHMVAFLPKGLDILHLVAAIRG